MSHGPLLVALAAVGLSGCGVMQSMMTTSVDDTAGATVIGLSGDVEVRRLGSDGNSFAVNLEDGARLKTADLVLGSDTEGSSVSLALDSKSRARFDEADWVLRSPLGEDSDDFAATVELGRVIMSVQGADCTFTLVDTNKNRVFLEDADAEFFVAVDDDSMTVFVRSGKITVTNERSELHNVVGEGTGIRIDGQGKAATHEPEAEIDWQIASAAPSAANAEAK